MASYPSAIVDTTTTFTQKVNQTTVIDASNVNYLQDEVRAIELTLGTNPNQSILGTGGSYVSAATNWTTLSARLNNYDVGILGDVHTQYIRKTADSANIISTGTASTKGLVIQGAASQSANLQEWQNSSGTVVAAIGPTGTITGVTADATKIPLSTVTTAGDLIVGTGSSTVGRLAVGTSSQVLAGGTTPAWVSSSHTLGTTAIALGSSTTSVVGLGLTTPALTSPLEAVNITNTTPTGVLAIDVLTSTVWYFSTTTAAAFTLNIRGNSSTTLNSVLAVGQAITVVTEFTNAAVGYYPTSIGIDGNAVTPKWQGGITPSTGNTYATDIYSFNILKTAANTYSVFASQVKFA